MYVSVSDYRLSPEDLHHRLRPPPEPPPPRWRRSIYIEQYSCQRKRTLSLVESFIVLEGWKRLIIIGESSFVQLSSFRATFRQLLRS
ncbi:hypothetical protein MIMGU_mgv1a023517mg [Erythranthe guttata]|uniref:Uncharacterized protein n=1 Tax=Erythranthe guttata TaxID=4155 RepID=A0A022Q6K7_ERYGU|nr:hypothetical protein MIMGU_mgv1a023517mg [Erythranthe guttata]